MTAYLNSIFSFGGCWGDYAWSLQHMLVVVDSGPLLEDESYCIYCFWTCNYVHCKAVDMVDVHGSSSADAITVDAIESYMIPCPGSVQLILDYASGGTHVQNVPCPYNYSTSDCRLYSPFVYRTN